MVRAGRYSRGRGNARDRSAAAAAPGARTGELDRLHRSIESGRALVDRLSTAEYSPASAVLTNRARDRYEEDLHRTCELLAEHLAEADRLVQEVTEDNRVLREENGQLRYTADKLRLELRQALGIAAATREDHSDGRSNRQGPPEKAGGIAESAKQTDSGRRGAPKGHRGRTRPVPAAIDTERLVAPPGVCDCGCDRVTPLHEFDTRYVEDIAPVTREVTRLI